MARIMICGTHSMGKSTLVADFLKENTHYLHEEEPYRALRQFHDIKFGKQATCFCNSLQLFYCISRTKQYLSADDCVIFDRSPLDYLPYSMYPAHYGETNINDEYVNALVLPIRQALHYVDILVYLPITNKHLVELEDDGIRPIDPDYRTEVDDYFKRIFRDNSFNLFSNNKSLKRIEMWGSRKERIAKLMALL